MPGNAMTCPFLKICDIFVAKVVVATTICMGVMQVYNNNNNNNVYVSCQQQACTFFHMVAGD